MKELYHAEAQLPERAHRKRALIAMAIIFPMNKFVIMRHDEAAETDAPQAAD